MAKADVIMFAMNLRFKYRGGKSFSHLARRFVAVVSHGLDEPPVCGREIPSLQRRVCQFKFLKIHGVFYSASRDFFQNPHFIVVTLQCVNLIPIPVVSIAESQD